MTNCSFTIEGPGLQKPQTVEHRDVEPEEEVEFSHTFTARKVGQRKLVVSFNSKEIKHLSASKVVTIEP